MSKPMHQVVAAIEKAVEDILWLGQHDAALGAAAVLAERRRQIELSYDVPHDRSHKPGWLARQGSVQGAVGAFMAEHDPDPDAARGLCAEAGALAAAEIDRLDGVAVRPVPKAAG